MKLFRNAKGFTLIELMVVILIIGILVAIAIPVFNASRESAYRRTCQANLRTIDGAVSTYRADNGSVPAAIGDLVPTYLKAVPACKKPGAAAYILTKPAGNPDTDTAECPTYKVNADSPSNPHTYP